MSSAAPLRDPYLVKSVVHCSKVLGAFSSPGEALPLREISRRCGLPKTMAFRLLYTLEKCSMVSKVGDNLYTCCVTPFKHRKFRIGYAAQGTEYHFSRVVSQSLAQAAQAEGVELISLDNRYSPQIAQRNADELVRERVDLAIEFQTDQTVAPIVAAKYAEAKIPFIAIEIPHPHAIFFGANNYHAGLIGGRYLGKWARQNWQSNVDEVILFELPRAGNLPRMRLTGMLTGLKESLASIEQCRVTYLDGDGCFSDSFDDMRSYLRSSPSRRILVGGVNDASVLGALRAFQETGRTEHCAIMGQNGSPEGRAELRQPGTRLVGSVAYFPERYGDSLIRLALDTLDRRPVPSAVFIKHQLITPETVNQLYPNDSPTEAAGVCRIV